jgi:hypothetical protein
MLVFRVQRPLIHLGPRGTAPSHHKISTNNNSPIHVIRFLLLSLTTIYRVAQKSVNLKHSLVLEGMFRFKPVSKFVERYHSAVNCALSMEDLISNSFCKFSK